MSKLEELLNELCPKGVPKTSIADICNISRGRVMSKDYIKENLGQYPVYSSQTENDGRLGLINSFDYDGEYLTWTTDGANAGTVFYRTGKFSITNVCGLLKVTNEQVLTKYLYYTLSVEAPSYVSSGMGNPKLMSNVMGRIKVAIPPLPVQSEIVRILDNFTELTAELTAELTTRKKQYEYYRDTMLACDKIESRKEVLLSEVATIKNGKDYKHLSGGNYPVYGSGGIMTYVDEYTYNKPSVLIPRKGSLRNLFYVDTPFWNVDTIFYTDVDTNRVLPKYLYYLLQKEHLEDLNTAGGVPSLTQALLNKVKLVIPTLEQQKKIVDCLDNFDSICSDLNIGLPAEIEARKKQYEFYRDALLTFAETGSIIAQTDRQTDRQTSIIR